MNFLACRSDRGDVEEKKKLKIRICKATKEHAIRCKDYVTGKKNIINCVLKIALNDLSPHLRDFRHDYFPILSIERNIKLKIFKFSFSVVKYLRFIHETITGDINLFVCSRCCQLFCNTSSKWFPIESISVN